MDKETIKNRHCSDNCECNKETFTEEQVVSLAQLITAGVMGIGSDECIAQAKELPMTLQRILISSVLASREVKSLMTAPSVLAKFLNQN